MACNGLVTIAEAENHRVQQFQFPPTGACAPLPAITPPPDPILATQPDPLPPEVSVTPTRLTGLLAVRQFPLRVRCDVRCRVAVVVKLTPRGKKKPTVTLAFSPQSLPAGNTVTVRPRLSVAGVRSLARALKGKRALTADVQVTASTTDSAPTVVTRRVNVTGYRGRRSPSPARDVAPEEGGEPPRERRNGEHDRDPRGADDRRPVDRLAQQPLPGVELRRQQVRAAGSPAPTRSPAVA